MSKPPIFPDIVGTDQAARDGMEKYVALEIRRIQTDRITYGPRLHAGQEIIIANKSRRKIVVAGNRWGKTAGMMRDVLWCARGEHPYRKVKPHTQIWVGAPDYPSYLKFHKPTFDEWCPPAWIEGSFNNSEKWVDIKRVAGGVCRIFFNSYDSERGKWQGAGVDGIWLDEECPEEIVNECLARIVTTRGWIVMTFTPVTGVGWWYDRFYEPALRGANNWFAFQAALASHDPLNEKEFNVGESLVPHLSREQIVEFAAEYPDPDERNIRVFGAVKSRTGLVYKGYAKASHVIPPFEVPERWDLWGGIDPGYHGFHVTLGAIAPDHPALYVIDEFFSSAESTHARFNQIKDKVRAIRPLKNTRSKEQVVVVFFVDTEDPQVVLELNIQAAQHAELESQKSDEEDKDPVVIVFASLDQGLKARKAGALRIQQCLACSPRNRRPPLVDRPSPPDGEPLLYFFDNLYTEWQGTDKYHRESRLLWEIARYSWKKPPRGKTVQPDDMDDESAAGAHGMSSFRYLVMARLGPIEDSTGGGSSRNEAADPVLAAIEQDFADAEMDSLYR